VPFLSWTSDILLLIFAVLFFVGIMGLHSARQKADKPRKDDLRGKTERKIMRYGSGLAIAASITGAIFYWFTAERVPVLSARFFFLIWFVVFAVWMWIRVVKPIRLLPLIHQEEVEREKYEKWLPRPKGR